MADARKLMDAFPALRVSVNAVKPWEQSGYRDVAVDIVLRGPDLDTLRTYADGLMTRLRTIPGIVNLDSSYEGGLPELQVNIDRTKSADLGVSVNDIAQQLPGGIFGQRHGARRTFVIIGLLAFLATLAMPLVPYILTGGGLFLALLAVQLLLGCSQAAIFPVSAGVFEVWFPPSCWTTVQGLQTMALGLGAALTPPLVATLMSTMGWQRALLWASLPALGLIALWAWYGRNTPREHPAMSARELAEIGSQDVAPVDSQINFKRLLLILKNRNVLLLAISYLCMNYTFYLLSNWVFLYLVQERHFSVLESGWLAMVPPLAAAAGAGVGGAITGGLCRRMGDRWGYRLVPLIARVRRRRLAVDFGECLESLSRGGGACRVLCLHRAQRRRLLGSGHDGGARGHHGGERRHEHRR